MAEQAGTFETLILEIGKAVSELTDRLSPDNALDLFADLGLRLPDTALTNAGFSNAVSQTATATQQVVPLIEAIETAIEAGDITTVIAKAVDLGNSVKTALTSFDSIASQLQANAGAFGIDPGDVTAFAAKLAESLLEFIIATYLEDYRPLISEIAQTIGLVDKHVVTGSTTDGALPDYIVRSLPLSRISDLMQSPGDLYKTIYGWNDPSFDGTALLSRIDQFLFMLSIPHNYDTSVTPPVLTTGLLSITPDLGVSPRGLTASVRQTIPSFNVDLPLTESGISVALQLDFPVTLGVGVLVQPPFAVSVISPPASVSGTASISLHKNAVGSDRVLIFGSQNASRLDAQSVAATVGGVFDWDGGSNQAKGDLDVSMGATNAHAVIDLSDADGFLTSVISGGSIDVPFSVQIGFSSTRGLYFKGSANLQTTVPLSVQAGGISLKTLFLGLTLPSGGLDVEASLAAAVGLGPFEMTVDRLGVIAHLKFTKGNLGPLDISFAFKPPSGLGVAVDAGLVAGGGYIFFDPDKGEYAGTFELSLADIVTVKVIAILDTKYPDGTSGFSFLLVITTDFPPIQLSFGFTLNGVGGIGGINRTMSVDALRAGLRAHRLDSVLFPPDPIGNAPQIISDLSAYFPPAKDRYIFGPMFSLGWGTPTLIDLQIGVILEVPDPIKIAILGLIACALPDEDVALIDLHIDVLGIIDFGAKVLTIQGSMYDSRVTIYSVYGGMAFMLTWGDNPNFAFSMGGLNPRFQPPPGFPQLDRLTVSIGLGDNPRLSSQSYFAVTSNSVQFGANIDLYAEAAGFSIHGYIGFDALFILSPFSFTIDFAAGLDIEYDGHSLASIHVDGMIAGPTPWHVHGDATLHFLFIDISASVDIHWGDDTPTSLPDIKVLDTLVPALNNARSWSAALPDGAAQAVSLGNPGDGLFVHPMGTLTVQENVVPLDLPITKVGNAKPSDGTLFSIGAVTINGAPAAPETDQQGYFAIGQFTDMSDADKLTAQAYQLFHDGKTVGTSAPQSGASAEKDIIYDEKYIDDYGKIAISTGAYRLLSNLQLYLAASSAGFRSAVKTTGPQTYVAPGTVSGISVGEVAYVVASTADLSVRGDITGSTTSQLAVTLAMQSYITDHPEAAGMLQVLPLHEAAA